MFKIRNQGEITTKIREKGKTATMICFKPFIILSFSHLYHLCVKALLKIIKLDRFYIFLQ